MKNILEKIVSKTPSKWFAESEERFKEKEIRDYFRTTPAKNVEEVEEWCKRQLERKCNK